MAIELDDFSVHIARAPVTCKSQFLVIICLQKQDLYKRGKCPIFKVGVQRCAAFKGKSSHLVTMAENAFSLRE